MEIEDLARRFENDRAHLRSVALRMLGSASDADDAVQETWMRLQRGGANGIENLTGWLTTVVAHVALDMLRSRTSRLAREAADPARAEHVASDTTPERETAIADAVGLALLVVLDQLDPAERLAFVLHDMFAMPFDEIATMIGRSVEATRQLASRARRRVQGAPTASAAELADQRATISAFLMALRAGDFDGLVAVLDPDVVVRIGDQTIHGATNWAKGATSWGRLAVQVIPMLVDGSVGLVFVPGGKLTRALRMKVVGGRITEVDVVAEPAQVAALEVAALPA